ncbi:YceI family protein [Streptomyces sp. NPDC047706]|uniref:YceI family protein n=1 Tax=Streptomyces sp. NPDC047706 TaxID=3365486 RepID=UPI0037188E43
MPDGAGILQCRILDPLGSPLGGATISVRATHLPHQFVGTSDSFGLFIAAMPPGEYTLQVSMEGLEAVSRKAFVAAGVPNPTEVFQLVSSATKALPTPGYWVFDPPHTAIRFIAKHVGMANVHGRFTSFSGSIHIAEHMPDSQVEVTIEAASITTGNRTRDRHLCSADFLDVQAYPYIHFVSKRFVHRSGNRWSTQGSLTMHGITRSVDLDTTYLGAVNGGYGTELRCAALATAELHREDFTLDWRSMLARGIAIVGPRIKLEIDVQAMHDVPNIPTPPQ